MDGFDDSKQEKGLHDRTGSILCCFQLIDISIGPSRVLMPHLEKLMEDLEIDQEIGIRFIQKFFCIKKILKFLPFSKKN